MLTTKSTATGLDFLNDIMFNFRVPEPHRRYSDTGVELSLEKKGYPALSDNKSGSGAPLTSASGPAWSSGVYWDLLTMVELLWDLAPRRPRLGSPELVRNFCLHPPTEKRNTML
ncbi:hypothetical protein CC2G_003088 [Coprinopsis cinerea AmutBmut pab1-1]|nr:hypothetical protein CC2G_003088 [Coprinopsis cinerea AmutBmut pab1-1]